MSLKKSAHPSRTPQSLYGRASSAGTSAGHMSPGSEPEALGQAADRGFSRLDSYWVGFTVESFVYTVEPPARTSRRTRAALPGRASPGSDLDDPLHLADVHVGTYSLVLRTNPIQSDERMRGRGRCPSSIIATLSRQVRSRRCAAERSVTPPRIATSIRPSDRSSACRGGSRSSCPSRRPARRPCGSGCPTTPARR